MSKGLADDIVAVFGYAPPGIWGGEIADHEQAIADLGERLMNEAKGRAVTQGVDLELLGSTPNKLLHITNRPVLVVPAER